LPHATLDAALDHLFHADSFWRDVLARGAGTAE
jgi:hypothetical protein